MQTQVIVLATGNTGKILEFNKMLTGYPIELKGLNDFPPISAVEEDGKTFAANAYKKAFFTAKTLGIPAIADDSGLVVDFLDGAPGIYSARYAGESATDQQNIDKLLTQMQGCENRQAAFECAISIALPNGDSLSYNGRCAGEITTSPQGTQGFGYDPVFFCPQLGKTFAESTVNDKNRISHRGIALEKIVADFPTILAWLHV